MVAGYETTTSTIGSAVFALAQDPLLAARLRADPAGIGDLVDEVLRMYAPLQGLFRKATQDVTIAGVTIPAGAIVMTRYGAANRDPEKFPDPGVLDPCRRNRSQHLSFGSGIHFCVGRDLARSEVRIAIEQLLARTRAITLARGPESWEHKTSFVTWGPQRLWLALERA